MKLWQLERLHLSLSFQICALLNYSWLINTEITDRCSPAEKRYTKVKQFISGQWWLYKTDGSVQWSETGGQMCPDVWQEDLLLQRMSSHLMKGNVRILSSQRSLCVCVISVCVISVWDTERVHVFTLCPTFWLMMLQKGGGEGISHNAMLLIPWARWMDGRTQTDKLIDGWVLQLVVVRTHWTC